jgi:hypothetical protein
VPRWLRKYNISPFKIINPSIFLPLRELSYSYPIRNYVPSSEELNQTESGLTGIEAKTKILIDFLHREGY